MRTSWTRRPAGVLLLALGCVALLWMATAGGNRAADPAKPADLEKYVPSQEELRAAYQRAAQPGPGPQRGGGVYKATITPHWFQNNTRFWYRNDLAGGNREFILVETEAGSRQP